MASSTAVRRTPYFSSYQARRQVRNFGVSAMVTGIATILLMGYLLPFVYMALTSVKTRDQIVASAKGSVLPMEQATFVYEGEEDPLLIYKVPLADGTERELALLQPGRKDSTFIDPSNPDAEPIVWEGAWRTLDGVQSISPHFENYEEVWETAKFPRLFFNTAVIAGAGVIGTLFSCICVAYAFARFPIPFKRVLFLVLISTIILPRQVLLVPTFTFFDRIGWTGSWLPLIVPHFFANAYNVFLLRQYFMGLPRELDEAAMIDGAGPLRILLYIIIPQSWPVIIAVALFHMVFAWNDYFEPLIYTLGNKNLQPIAVGIQQFNFVYNSQPSLIQATALLGMVVPVLLFFFAQRFFMRGVVVTGVDK
jgi:multiple sugar transport system permease protein